VITARTYTAKYRDGNRYVQEVATGCRDESAAWSILAKLERRAELVKGEVLTAAEDAIVDHQGTPLAASACPVKQKRPLTSTVIGRLNERETGIEPATTSLGS
jgi:hypothetical protein